MRKIREIELKKAKEYIGLCLLILSVVAIVIFALQATMDDIWYDEVFSMRFAKADISEMIALTALDVHPPFYYIYLKSIINVLQVFGLNTVVAAKFASILPWCGLLVLSMTLIRKRYGLFTAGTFMFLITLMPQIGNYYIEIRMYSLALLFITISFVLALELMRRQSLFKWIAFFLIGVLTAYTQYYACIGIVGVYIAFLLLILLDTNSRDEKKTYIIRLIICGIMSVIAYIPWIGVFLKQITNVAGSYWILPLTLRSIPGCIKYAVLPVSYDGKWCMISACLLIADVCAMLVMLFKSKKLTPVIMMHMLPIIVVILSGFIFTWMKMPIFVYRYMIPVLGLVWLMVAIMLNECTQNKAYSMMMLVPILMVALFTYRGVYGEEHNKLIQMSNVHEAFESIPQDSIVITNFDHVAALASYYLEGRDVYLYNLGADGLIEDMFDNFCGTIEDDGIKTLPYTEKPVYFLGSFVSRDEILDDWSEFGIGSEMEASVLLERYWINIYKLEK